MRDLYRDFYRTFPNIVSYALVDKNGSEIVPKTSGTLLGTFGTKHV